MWQRLQTLSKHWFCTTPLGAGRLVVELGGNLGMNPELAFLDAEVAEVSEYRVTGNDITVGRVSPSTVKG